MKDETITKIADEAKRLYFVPEGIKSPSIKSSFKRLEATFIQGANFGYLLANQSLTEQNQKLVNEAVKMREAFEKLVKYCAENRSYTPYELNEFVKGLDNSIRLATNSGLTINEKGEG